MGYAASYRTSAARNERAAFKAPRPSYNPTRPANDNRPFPKPANDNFAAQLPPNLGKFVRSPAVRRAANLAFRIHPALRVLSNLWDLWQLYEGYKNTNTHMGDWFTACDVGFGAGCTSPAGGSLCCQPGVLGDCYCMGPSFTGGINNPSLCGIAGQAGTGGTGYFPPTTIGFSSGVGVLMWAFKFGTAAPPAPCHPSKMIAQFRRVQQTDQPRTMTRQPHRVPYTHVVAPPWVRYRWFKPNVLMKPQVDYDNDIAPPPYPYIPNREMEWPSTRGYTSEDVSTSPRAQQQLAPRQRTPARTKETKVKWNGFTNVLHAVLVSLGKVHGKMADLRDILGAFNDSLPSDLRLKGKDAKSIPKLMENVYRHAEKMDGEKALLGVIKEIAEDQVGGFGDKLRSDAAKNFGWLKNKIHASPRF